MSIQKNRFIFQNLIDAFSKTCILLLMETKTFTKGDKVRVNVLGSKVETVLYADDCMVETYENLTSWYHPTKVVRA